MSKEANRIVFATVAAGILAACPAARAQFVSPASKAGAEAQKETTGEPKAKATKQVAPGEKEAQATAKKRPPEKAAGPAAAREQKDVPAQSGEELSAQLAEIRGELAAIREALEEQSPPAEDQAPPAPEPTLSEEQEAEKARLAAERDTLVGQRTQLEQAISNGLDETLVQDKLSSLDARMSEIDAAIAAIVPASPAPPDEEGSSAGDAPAQAQSQSPGENPAPAAPEEEEVALVGLNFDFGFSSVYNFRGVNVFKGGSQHDQHAAFFPFASWSVGDSGVTLSYGGAYQVNGGNEAELVEVGAGHEQDLYIYWSRELAKGFSLDTYFAWYFYPFADEDDAGATMPSYLEPSIGISYAGSAVDIGLTAAYFIGLQEALHPYSYLYLRPFVGKSIEFNDIASLDMAFGVGFKIWQDENHADFDGDPDGDNELDNVFDLQFDVAIPIQISDKFYLSPAIHAAWSNFADLAVGDEYMLYGSINIGANL